MKWAAIPIIKLVRDIYPQNTPAKFIKIKKKSFPSYRADKFVVQKDGQKDRPA